MRQSPSLALLWAFSTAAFASPTKPAASNNHSFQIQWANCPGEMPSNLDCGQFQVPLDWSKPNGAQITLGMTRVNATDNSARIGSLVFNPGGPGGIATQFCQYQAMGVQIFSEATNKHFDIICPDPRGIGTSSPIRCDPDLWNQRQSLFPKDNASFEEMVQHNRAFGESCLNLTGDLFKHVDTTSVAKDIEAIRRALNDGKLNWLGESYGTQI